MKKYKILFALFAIISLSSCENNSGEAGQYSNNIPSQNPGGENVDGNNVVVDTNHKIIYTVTYSIQCENISTIIKEINTNLYTLGGYISSSRQESNYYANFVYKIPTEKLNEMLDFIDGNDGVDSKTVTTEDITSSYDKLKAEIETLEASKEAYQNMLKNDNLNVSEIVTITNRIEEIDTRLKTLYGQLNNYDNLLDYSTINITYTTKTQGYEEGFLSNYGSFLLAIGQLIVSFIAYCAPFLIVAGLVSLIIFIVKKKKNAN